MKPILLILLILAVSTANVAAGKSCRDRYTCSSEELCFNGSCVPKIREAEEGRRQLYARYKKHPYTTCAYGFHCRSSEFCVSGRCRAI